MVHPARFELTTFGSASQRSIQLSYGCSITGVIIPFISSRSQSITDGLCYYVVVAKHRSNLSRSIALVYKDLLVTRYKDRHFWILSAFIPTFIIARLLVRIDPRIFLQVHGNHVHHFTYGFVLLAVSGYLAIVRPRRAPNWLAVMFGIGLALAIDETGMWLHLTDQYYDETSENAVILVLAFLINIVYFREFWLRLIKEFIYWLRSI
jgi:hypothetical protein